MAIENMGRYGISRRFAMGFAKKKTWHPWTHKKETKRGFKRLWGWAPGPTDGELIPGGSK
jgi:hypothetical protein